MSTSCSLYIPPNPSLSFSFPFTQKSLSLNKKPKTKPNPLLFSLFTSKFWHFFYLFRPIRVLLSLSLSLSLWPIHREINPGPVAGASRAGYNGGPQHRYRSPLLLLLLGTWLSLSYHRLPRHPRRRSLGPMSRGSYSSRARWLRLRKWVSRSGSTRRRLLATAQLRGGGPLCPFS